MSDLPPTIFDFLRHLEEWPSRRDEKWRDDGPESHPRRSTVEEDGFADELIVCLGLMPPLASIVKKTAVGALGTPQPPERVAITIHGKAELAMRRLKAKSK
jgi:hypothetical protein